MKGTPALSLTTRNPIFTTEIHPRVSETDAVGHINNTVVPVWFEAARRDFFPLCGPVDDFSRWRMIVVNLTVDYLHELRYPDPVVVCTWVERLGNSSLTLYEEMKQGGVLCARGRATYVNVNPETRQTEALSNSVRAALSEHFTSREKDSE